MSTTEAIVAQKPTENKKETNIKVICCHKPILTYQKEINLFRYMQHCDNVFAAYNFWTYLSIKKYVALWFIKPDASEINHNYSMIIFNKDRYYKLNLTI